MEHESQFDRTDEDAPESGGQELPDPRSPMISGHREDRDGAVPPVDPTGEGVEPASGGEIAPAVAGDVGARDPDDEPDTHESFPAGGGALGGRADPILTDQRDPDDREGD